MLREGSGVGEQAVPSVNAEPAVPPINEEQAVPPVAHVQPSPPSRARDIAQYESEYACPSRLSPLRQRGEHSPRRSG